MDVLSFTLLLRCMSVYSVATFGAGALCFALGSFVLMPLYINAYAYTNPDALHIRKGIFYRICIPYTAIAAVHLRDGGLSVEYGRRSVFLRVEDEVAFLRALRDKLAQL